MIKKVLCTLFVAVCCMAMAIPANAQVSFGVKGGLNLSKMDWKIADTTINNVKENSTGFFIGPMIEATVPIVGLGVDGAVMYSQRGSGDLKQQGIEVPVNLKYSIGVGDMAAIFFASFSIRMSSAYLSTSHPAQIRYISFLSGNPSLIAGALMA